MINSKRFSGDNLVAVVAALRNGPDTEKQRQSVVADVKKLVYNVCEDEHDVKIVGSAACGLDTISSDVDLALIPSLAAEKRSRLDHKSQTKAETNEKANTTLKQIR
jgi:DNA polymerase sigma